MRALSRGLSGNGPVPPENLSHKAIRGYRYHINEAAPRPSLYISSTLRKSSLEP